MPGWKSSTEEVREFKDLPENAKNYVNKIEDILEVPGETELHSNLLYTYFHFISFFFSVRWIGVGKGRNSIINIFPIES